MKKAFVLRACIPKGRPNAHQHIQAVYTHEDFRGDATPYYNFTAACMRLYGTMQNQKVFHRCRNLVIGAAVQGVTVGFWEVFQGTGMTVHARPVLRAIQDC